MDTGEDLLVVTVLKQQEKNIHNLGFSALDTVNVNINVFILWEKSSASWVKSPGLNNCKTS